MNGDDQALLDAAALSLSQVRDWLGKVTRRGDRYKMWVTKGDDRVRPAHRAAHGQIRPIDEPFTVGGESLVEPGDPTASPANRINCRCRAVTARTRKQLQRRNTAAAVETQEATVAELNNPRLTVGGGMNTLAGLATVLAGLAQTLADLAEDLANPPTDPAPGPIESEQPSIYLPYTAAANEETPAGSEEPPAAPAHRSYNTGPGVARRLVDRVALYVATSPVPVSAQDVATHLSLTMNQASTALAAATQQGLIKRTATGLYAAPSHLPEGQDGPPGTDDTPENHQQTGPSGNGTTPTGHDHTAAAPPTDFDVIEASAWTELQAAPPMPAEWFREPTPEELPADGGGVHYRDGRIWGWVARAGEPHAGMPGQGLTIESLGKIDTSHFLRTRFNLDDGTTVKAGAFTMNVGHHRDGAECETAACQFDDTRTVAAVVTVGQNKGGMWFSGAAGPWLSEWDRTVLQACQPSYHMIRGGNGAWQLRAVLSVPVPGHSTPLAAAAVERSNLALAASR